MLVCGLCKRVWVCLFVVYCVTLFGMLFVLFCMCCVYVVVWFVCDRVCGGYGLLLLTVCARVGLT